MPKEREFQKQLESIAGLVHRIDAAADPSLRADAHQLVETLMALHGGGLERALEIIGAAGEAGQGIIDRLSREERVASLLVLHGLHPLDFETRLRQGIDKARSFLKTHAAELETIAIEGGAVRLVVKSNGRGCGSSSLEEAVEELIYESAPDVTSLVVESAVPQSFVPLEMLGMTAGSGKGAA